MRFTDDERRAVAARLREKHRERTSPLLMEPQDVDMQAFGYLRDLASCVPDGKSLFAVLADLVEPSCDRGALLALADEMDAEKNFVIVGGYARRIREALGAKS